MLHPGPTAPLHLTDFLLQSIPLQHGLIVQSFFLSLEIVFSLSEFSVPELLRLIQQFIFVFIDVDISVGIPISRIVNFQLSAQARNMS